MITWLSEHWKEVADVVAYAIAAASIVVKLTPTTKDDVILGKIISFIGKYVALNK